MSRPRLLAAAILLLSAAPVWADEAEDAFNSLYGNEYKRVTGTPDKNDDVALAADLLKAVKTPGVHPALLAILCDKAYELGTKAPAGYDSAIEAMELLAQQVPDKAADALKNLAAVREKQYQAVKGLDKTGAGGVFVEALLVAADASTKGGATAEAMTFLRKAFGAAKAVKSDRQDEIQGRIDLATMRERLRKRVSDLKARLAANPQDVAANAWVAIAVFTYQSRTGDASFLPRARRTLDWLSDRVMRIRISGQEYQAMSSDAGPGPAAVPSTKATAVCHAACRTAEVLTGEARYGVLASALRRFLCDVAWDDRRGVFTEYDAAGDPRPFTVDLQTWPVLALGPEGPRGERFARALEWCEEELPVQISLPTKGGGGVMLSGLGFSREAPHTVYVEGMLQAAAAYEVIGQPKAARKMDAAIRRAAVTQWRRFLFRRGLAPGLPSAACRRGDVLVPVQRGHAASEPAGASCRNGRSAVGGCAPATGMKPHAGGVT